MSFQTDSDVGEPWIGVGYKEAGVSPANASMRSEWEVRTVPLRLPGSEVAGKWTYGLSSCSWPSLRAV